MEGISTFVLTQSVSLNFKKQSRFRTFVLEVKNHYLIDLEIYILH